VVQFLLWKFQQQNPPVPPYIYGTAYACRCGCRHQLDSTDVSFVWAFPTYTIYLDKIQEWLHTWQNIWVSISTFTRTSLWTALQTLSLIPIWGVFEPIAFPGGHLVFNLWLTLQELTQELQVVVLGDGEVKFLDFDRLDFSCFFLI
jgi:hypothetical protein